jgi:hypothetical protein
MANDPQFRVQDDRFEAGASVPAEPKKRSALSTCLTGCLIVFVVILILGAIAIWWIWRNAGELGAAAISRSKVLVAASDLSAEEKAGIDVQIDRLAEATRTGKLSIPQLMKFLEINMRPLTTLVAASSIADAHIAASGMPNEEKDEARLTIQRFIHGALENKIGDASQQTTLAPLSEQRPDGTIGIRNNLTDDELKAFLKSAKEQADAAGIPTEVEAVDPSDEFKRLVDKTLGEGAAEAAAGENAPVEDAAEPAEEAAPAN